MQALHTLLIDAVFSMTLWLGRDKGLFEAMCVREPLKKMKAREPGIGAQGGGGGGKNVAGATTNGFLVPLGFVLFEPPPPPPAITWETTSEVKRS